MNNSMSTKSPSLFDQNTHFLDMSGNLGSHFGAMESRQGIVPLRAHANQQMSEVAVNDFNDRLSTGGANRPLIH
jgi:hypothetical protein